jgi:hypothetical protein
MIFRKHGVARPLVFPKDPQIGPGVTRGLARDLGVSADAFMRAAKGDT